MTGNHIRASTSSHFSGSAGWLFVSEELNERTRDHSSWSSNNNAQQDGSTFKADGKFSERERCCQRKLTTGVSSPQKSAEIFLSPRVIEKLITIPHSTLNSNYLQSYDEPPQRWGSSSDNFSSNIALERIDKSSTIEGGSSTGDTSIGGSDLHIAITAHQTDTEHINDNCNNRGGGGGAASVSCSDQSPPTPTVGKTLLNTSANLLPITTATDTFNNLKNLVKIDKGAPTANSNPNGNGYRSKGNGGYKNGGTRFGSPTFGESRNIANGPISGRSGATGASGHFSNNYSRNSAKIRQHDSDVIPRPRRTYQSDSSSSRYYNKNSDNLSQSGQPGGTSTGALNGSGRTLNSEPSARGALTSEGRRTFQSSDGGYNRNVNSAPGGNYRQQQGSRYENSGSGNGQQRQYGTTTNAGYNNYNNKSSYAPRGSIEGNVNSRSSYREDYGNSYRDYEDAPRQRYGNSNSTNSGSSNNTNSLERSNNSRYNKSSDSGSASLPPSALRPGVNSDGYERSAVENRPHSNRTPPLRGGNVAAASAPTSSVNSTSSSSRGISPNSPNTATVTQQQQPIPALIQQLPITGRWVPPSLRPQHGLTQSEKNDAIFRKVRGILNKLTPEKFQELSDELLKLDLNSIAILNGVILLIFDKALDEPKYSSMYAQLCKRLTEEAPSFEKDPNISCTFLRLLIAVCRDKFNNRLKRDGPDFENNNQFNKVHRIQGPATGTENDGDEEERRHLAKQRMLGNVKFIGELNKLDMLSTNVLHQCIMELLDKRKKRSVMSQEMCEDMECLAQLLKTCGKNLDSEQGKELMNQYFETLERRSKYTDYPPRIRFMLKDVIELRENNWIPRKVATTEGPVPIKQIRTDDDSLMRTPFMNRNRDMRNNDRDGDNWMNRFHLNLQTGFSDVFGGLSGSSPIMSPFNSNPNNRPYNNRDRNNQGNNYNNRYNKHNNPNGSNGGRDDMRNNQHMNREQSNSQFGNNQMMMGNKELAPRFKRNLMSTNSDPVENLQMRPAANSLLFKAASQNQKMPTMLPITTPPNGNNASHVSNMHHKEQLSNAQYPLLGTPTSHLTNPARPSSTPSAEYDLKVGQSSGPASLDNKGLKATSSSPNFVTSIPSHERINGSDSTDPNTLAPGEMKLSAAEAGQLITKQGSVENTGGGANLSSKQQKKDKAFNKEEVLKKTSTFIKEKFFYQESENCDENESEKQLNELVDGFLELKVPEKCMKDVCLNIVMDVLDKSDDKYLDRVIVFMQALRKQANIKPNILLEVFKQVVNKMNEREALNPRIATHVASLLCRAVGEASLIKLNDIANYTDNGHHYPLFLLVLQQLHKNIGKEALEEKFRGSKIDLMSSLPETDRNKTRLGEILDDRNLAFLYPLLKVQAEMLKQLIADPNPAVFYKWLKGNVDTKYYKDPGFISALMTVILKFVTQETSLAEGVDIKKHPDKPICEKEEELMGKYCQILCTCIGGNTDLQLVALYALQVFCFNEGFPKGMLWRWFKYLYETEVVYEETFLLWKEEISDKYPGKGSALFQVNTWLTWLQEAESEDDED